MVVERHVFCAKKEGFKWWGMSEEDYLVKGREWNPEISLTWWRTWRYQHTKLQCPVTPPTCRTVLQSLRHYFLLMFPSPCLLPSFFPPLLSIISSPPVTLSLFLLLLFFLFYLLISLFLFLILLFFLLLILFLFLLIFFFFSFSFFFS